LTPEHFVHPVSEGRLTWQNHHCRCSCYYTCWGVQHQAAAPSKTLCKTGVQRGVVYIQYNNSREG
jgi:hypothetical protein